jgi:hypothetical protein
MIRMILLGIVAFVACAIGSAQASAQYYVPNFVYRVPYQAPVTYYRSARVPYYPRVYRYYDSRYYGYPPGTVIYNIYGPRRTVRVPSTGTTQPTESRPITGHPSHYFGDPHGSQYFPR